ncbi:MAG: hypothetical protein MRY79_03575 [Alphaproteobacteria bacterium]|nr:hypothetical protein [Alphaproteobacteria bacterium]
MQKVEKQSRPIKHRLKSLFNLRSAAGITFLAGDLILAFGGAVNENWANAASGALLVAASVCVVLSSKNPRWLYVVGSNIVASQALIAWAAEGSGQLAQRLGTIAPVLNGLLVLRGAWQATQGISKKFKSKTIFSKPLEVVDRYPLFAGSSIELPGAVAISAGAAMSGNVPLATAAALWVLGLGLLAASDPNSRRACIELRHQARKLGNYLT